jgi:ABC-type antimicrobial peptide transport system permease subunit
VKDHDLTRAPLRRAYAPYVQQVDGRNDPGSLIFEVRARGDPAALERAVRREIVAVDPLLPIASASPLSLSMRRSIAQERLMARVTTGFGLLALLLAAVGLYGVMSYATARRIGELGLRMALGAQRADVFRLVLTDALRLVMLGLAAGVPLALASARLLRAQLHGVGTADRTAMATAIAVLALSAIVAALVPAARAARVTPLVSLRGD